jgi:hypothetical protein
MNSTSQPASDVYQLAKEADDALKEFSDDGDRLGSPS